MLGGDAPKEVGSRGSEGESTPRTWDVRCQRRRVPIEMCRAVNALRAHAQNVRIVTSHNVCPLRFSAQQ